MEHEHRLPARRHCGSTSPSRRRRRLAEAAITPLLPADVLDLFHPLRPGADLRGRIVDGPARDRGRRHDRDPARAGLGRPRARPVRPDRHRRRRRPPVARLLPDPRPPGRRPDLDHRQGGAGRQGQQPPGPRARPGTLVHLEQAAGEFVLPSRRRQAALRHRRLRHHPGHRDAAQPLPGDRHRAGAAGRAARPTTSSSCTSRPASRTRSSSTTSARSTRRTRSGSSRGTTTCTASSTSPTSADLVPDLDERTTFACGPAGLLDAIEEHHDARGLPLLTEQFRTARRRGRGRHRHASTEPARSSRPTAPPRSSTPARTRAC